MYFTPPSHIASDGSIADMYSDITEPSGWNDILDQAWRGAVDQANTPTGEREAAVRY